MDDNLTPTTPSPTESWTAPRSRDAWERTSWLWSLFFFIGLIIGLAPTLLDETLPAASRVWGTVITILLALWHLGGLYVARRYGHFRTDLRLAMVYVGGLIAIWFLLIRIHPNFYAAQMGIWSQLFIALPIGWAAAVAFLIFGLNIFQQTIGVGGPLNWPETFLWFGIVAVGVVFGYWLDVIITQSNERKELIEKLEKTQARLAQSERAAGVAAERQRLAHEIHDTLAQGFISIIMHLEAAEQALPEGLPTARQHLGQVRQTARDSLEQARRVVNDLRPEVLESAPFDEAVQRVVADWSTASGIPAAFTRTGERHPLHPEVEVTLLRATQEALANVRKHAQAGRVQVTLSYLGDVVILDVEDDGLGVGQVGEEELAARTSAVSGKFGLVAMRERVEQLGGELLVESEAGEGTTVAVSIPVEAAA